MLRDIVKPQVLMSFCIVIVGRLTEYPVNRKNIVDVRSADFKL